MHGFRMPSPAKVPFFAGALGPLTSTPALSASSSAPWSEGTRGMVSARTLRAHGPGVVCSLCCAVVYRRYDDPNSAGSSFSMLLGDAPHLDGKVSARARDAGLCWRRCGALVLPPCHRLCV